MMTFIDVVEPTCSPDAALAKSGNLLGVSPDCAEPVIGRRFAPTRWLHLGYGSHARIFVTLAPIGCPKISDNVRQYPSPHSRHSPAAPCRRRSPSCAPAP